ncbi:MAG: hypothetical protein ACJASV_001459 [Pseudorhodobacter sp.]|jgi:hypothetical protein
MIGEGGKHLGDLARHRYATEQVKTESRGTAGSKRPNKGREADKIIRIMGLIRMVLARPGPDLLSWCLLLTFLHRFSPTNTGPKKKSHNSVF